MEMFNNAFLARLSSMMVLSCFLICSSNAWMDSMLISPLSLFLTGLGYGIPWICWLMLTVRVFRYLVGHGHACWWELGETWVLIAISG